MKKVTTTKYVASEWECWKDEKYPYWYIGKTGTQTYLAMTYNERNARLITAAPEMYELLKAWTQIRAEPTLKNARKRAEELLDSIDGKEIAHEGTE